MARRFVAGAAASAALVIALAGCGGGTSKSNGAGNSGTNNTRLAAVDTIAQVSQKTSRTTSFKADVSMNMSYSGQPITIQGTLEAKTKPPIETSMDISQMQFAGQSIPGGMQEVSTPGAIYIKSPMLSQMSGGKPWIKMSFSSLKKQTGVDIQGLLNQSQQVDPATSLKMFTASADAHKVGTDTINGIDTTHYAGTYSVQQALSRLNAQQQQQLHSMLGQAGLDKLNFDLWVDGQSLPRKVTIKSPPGSNLQMNVTMAVTDYNKPVTITPPPASEVNDNPSFSGLPGMTG